MDGDLDFNIELGGMRPASQQVQSSNDLEKQPEVQQQPQQTQESDSVAAGEEKGPSTAEGIRNFLSGAAHPGYCVLHFAFKLVAIILYLVLGMLLTDKTICFIVVTTLDVCDFWVVKNLTGR